MSTPPRRSHSTLSREIFSGSTSNVGSPPPASFLPSDDQGIESRNPKDIGRSASHVWSRGRSTIPAKPALSTSTSSSSEWTDDEQFLTLRPASKERDSAVRQRRYRWRFETSIPKKPTPSTIIPGLGRGDIDLEGLNPSPQSPVVRSSRFTPASFSNILRTSSASKINGSKHQTYTPNKDAVCNVKKTRSAVGKSAIAGDQDPENEENHAPSDYRVTPPRSTSIGDELTPLSPNVELHRGSARHRFRPQLAVEDDNPFKDLASCSEADDSSDPEMTEVSTMDITSPAAMSNYF
ncbi:hypothetical protein KVT40_007381 [Elsinoe batatas]|uniref:Uncharacterized protein n=1 Tax=Elsinoe batatas TaxID=2601811 RepID=A0A8K0PG82_9PEZI|nr:hypothetical protein KVT40_007381 [Elsinoe batatas]